MMNDIREMDLKDLPRVVDVHLASFMGFFLSSMGGRFLRELYKSILLDETHVAFVCRNEVEVSGFVVGTIQPFGFYRRTIKRGWARFAMVSIAPVLKKPLMAVRLLRRVVMTSGTVFEDECALLMSIAVAPDVQGKGIGQRLVFAFLEEARSRGCAGVILTTDALENDSVNRFYVRMGFCLSREFVTPEGRRMNEYIYRFGK